MDYINNAYENAEEAMFRIDEMVRYGNIYGMPVSYINEMRLISKLLNASVTTLQDYLLKK